MCAIVFKLLERFGLEYFRCPRQFLEASAVISAAQARILCSYIKSLLDGEARLQAKGTSGVMMSE